MRQQSDYKKSIYEVIKIFCLGSQYYVLLKLSIVSITDFREKSII